MPETDIQQDMRYKKAAALVDDYVEIHKGETFNLDDICRHSEISSREGRRLIAIKLSYDVKHGKLEKTNKYYRVIDKNVKYIDWVNASVGDTLDLSWPYGRDDGSQFGFDGRAVISPGDVIVIAGVSNMGKTAFCLNLLWENFDKFSCVLMGNEYKPAKFKRRVSRMDWADPLKEDGTPKFKLIERHEGWKDIIEPDSINIIDWINLGDNFYQIGKIIEGIQEKLRNGIVVVSLQKGDDRDLAIGGQYTEHLSSVYLTVDFERITVRKVKEWKDWNPNKAIYGFSLADGGTKFCNIRPIKKCPKCWAVKPKCDTCDNCNKGWIDA